MGLRRVEGDFPLVPPADVARARILDVPTNRHKELLRGMRTTLERLKATAEATS